MAQYKKGSREELAVFIPGMINSYGIKGRFPAISITGKTCALSCKHCKGYLLEDMVYVTSKEELLRTLSDFEKKGMIGALLSGGADRTGKLPWQRFLPSLIGFRTNLYLIAHGGINLPSEYASLMKKAGIKQVLIDVIGDKKTLAEIYHIQDFKVMENTLHNAYLYGPNVAPHVIAGLFYGRIRGEYDALDMIAEYSTENVIIVVFMPDILKVPPPKVEEVVRLFEYAHHKFDNVTLGCARPRGKYRRELEKRLIEKGLIKRMALWSSGAEEAAKKKGMKVKFYEGCCSIDLNVEIPI